MGFIEDLRRRRMQEEAEAQRVAVERERLDDILRQQKEVKRLSEDREKERINQSRERAKNFFKQSEFPRLAVDLASAVDGMTLINGVLRLVPIKGYDNEYGIMSNMQHRNFHRTSIDWAESSFIEDVDGISLIWGEGVSKVIVIGCDEKGTITIVKSWGDIKLALSKWSKNPTLQEDALGKAFKNPRKFDHIPSSPNTGSNEAPGMGIG